MTNTNTPAAPLPPAGEAGKANGTDMVTVCCKLPNGLVLEVGRTGDDNHTVVRLNGSNASRVIGGFGMTQVSKNVWEEWLAKHKRLDFVKKGLVFVHGTIVSAEAEATERAGLKNGFEAVDPHKQILGSDGKVLLETDMSHFNQAKQDVAQARQARNPR